MRGGHWKAERLTLFETGQEQVAAARAACVEEIQLDHVNAAHQVLHCAFTMMRSFAQSCPHTLEVRPLLGANNPTHTRALDVFGKVNWRGKAGASLDAQSDGHSSCPIGIAHAKKPNPFLGMAAHIDDELQLCLVGPVIRRGTSVRHQPDDFSLVDDSNCLLLLQGWRNTPPPRLLGWPRIGLVRLIMRIMPPVPTNGYSER